MLNSLKLFYKNNTGITHILLLGLILRLIFTWFIAPAYFSRENINFDYDTSAWMDGLYHLVFDGEFNLRPGFEPTAYCRMPGYSLFMLPAYALVYLYYVLQGIDVKAHSEMWWTVLKLTAYLQIVLDVLSIYFIYVISKKLLKNETVGIITAILYAFYPFIIVWNPVCYSEVPSVFFALWAIYLLVHKTSPAYFILAGLSFGFAVLNRPQFAVMAPFVVFILLQVHGKLNAVFMKKAVLFYLFFAISYGAWPLRNYIRFNKIIVTQDLSGFDNWNEDVIAFMQYIYGIKAEWQPQFGQILSNQKVVFPKVAYTSVDDSLKLEYAVSLAKTCGSGFSKWDGYWKAPILQDNTQKDCAPEIAQIFNELREKQKNVNPFNFYVKVPLQNLKKALFKSDLADNSTPARRLGGYLFYYRSVLLLAGIVGIAIMLYKKQSVYTAIAIGSFFVLLYIYLCFGTSPQCRNIEMRYFLQTDILMLIPAAYLLSMSKIIQSAVAKFTKPKTQ